MVFPFEMNCFRENSNMQSVISWPVGANRAKSGEGRLKGVNAASLSQVKATVWEKSHVQFSTKGSFVNGLVEKDTKPRQPVGRKQPVAAPPLLFVGTGALIFSTGFTVSVEAAHAKV
ncbi:MAG: hypothetical protein KGR98_12965 [Verrucomicrobia bacterium]|nr:hypothetical protein [Verrucomicrobiota bacterium]